MLSSHGLARRIGCGLWAPEEWVAWAEDGRKKAELPMEKARQKEPQRLKQFRAKRPAAARKRPAAKDQKTTILKLRAPPAAEKGPFETTGADSMSTIERERRVEFNDGMDELPSLDNDVENLCDVLEGGNPRTAAIMRRRYEKKGLMKAFPGEKTFTPPSALGLQPPLQRLAPLPRPEPAPLPVEQPIVPNKLEQKVFQASMETPERKSFERKSFERKSWADMSTDSEDESPENVESFASSDEGTVGTQLTWDPIGAEVWLKMTGKSMEKHLSAQEPQPAPPMAPVARAPGAPGAPAMATPPEAMSPSDQGQGMTGYVPCQPTVMSPWASFSARKCGRVGWRQRLCSTV
ncbi:unnamed protein product [Cladocopium goreaui]|uniref:Uncharacterized protein n=1 Tax=Cladocopium goreaui TaxID=2562237 RepID=A0A9P1BYJ1_9DINO|nr:unnamed protein product [Cladocopium goreaui]